MATRFRNARLVRLGDQRGLSFSSLTRGQVRLQRVTQAEGAFVKIPPAPRKSARTTRVPSHRSFNTPSDHVRRYHELDHRARRQGARRAGVRGARSREGESRKSFPRGLGSLANPERVERARRTRGVRRRDLEPERPSIPPPRSSRRRPAASPATSSAPPRPSSARATASRCRCPAGRAWTRTSRTTSRTSPAAAAWSTPSSRAASASAAPRCVTRRPKRPRVATARRVAPNVLGALRRVVRRG